MKKRSSCVLRTALIALALSAAQAAQAESGFYLSHDIGVHRADPLKLRGHANDYGSICDHGVNPFPETIPARCSDGSGMGTAWRSKFDSATGILASGAVGYRFGPGGRLRLEAEYSYADSPYNQNVAISADGATATTKLAKAGGEVVIAEDQLQSFTTHGVFANIYADFPNQSRWTPYAGFGAGISFSALDYDLFWVRNSDPNAITSIIDEFTGTPEQLQTVQRNLAGTVSSLHKELADRVVGYQFILGVDYELTEAFSIGLKARRTAFGKFKDRNEIDQVRSHAPALTRGPGNNESVYITTRAPNHALTSFTLNLKYRF